MFSFGVPSWVSRVHAKKDICERFLPLSDSEIRDLDRLDRYDEVCSSHLGVSSYKRSEVIALLDTGIPSVGKPLTDSLEFYNLDRAIDYYKSYKGELTEQFIKNIHRVVIQGTLSDVADEGKYRRGSSHIDKYITCPPEDISKEMASLVEWFDLNKNSLDPVLLAVRFKYRFLVIHPFSNGNGRVSRLLLNFILYRNGFCPLIIEPEEKNSYYYALHECVEINNSRGERFKCESLEQFICSQLVKFYCRRLDILNEIQG